MGGEFYEEMQGIASELLAEFDQRSGDGTDETDGLWYVRMVAGAGPPDEPGEPTPQAIKVNAVARGVQFKYVDGTTIVSTDLQMTMEVKAGITPKMKDFVKANGVSHKIVGLRTIPPTGVPVTHVVIFRK